ncbi:MAG TPA: hypothetical protein VLK37_00820 [Solirubrobacterales bacterium]|nr:hypothetical protein [Solirubrobacterales bacterium]
MGPVRISRRRLAAAFPLTLVAVLATLALGGAASASAAVCPSFKVLHDDRIGAVVLPAGSYEVTVSGGLSCPASSKLFARFLSDWDGNLPKPWRASAEGSGKATFTGAAQSFSVRRVSGGGGGGGNTEIGKLCPGTFTVNAGSDVGPLYFAKGPYLVYIPVQSAISCRRASVLFTRFLGAPGGMLPDPWQVMTQTATFFKPAHPLRSAFRLEPANGV